MSTRRNAVLRAVGIVVVIGLWLVVAGIGGPAIGKLSSVQSNDSTAFLPEGAESVRASELAAGFVQDTSLPAFVIFSSDAAITPEQLAAWQQFAAALPSVPVVDDEHDWGLVGDYLAAPQIPVVPSDDGLAGLVVVPLLQENATARDAEGDSAIGAVVDTIRQSALDNAAGAQANVAGPAGLITDLTKAFGGIDGILLLVALGAVLIILLLVYRALAIPFVVLFTSVSALAFAGWMVYLLADADVLLLNGQSQGILFILVVGAATDYGLLLVARFREELTHTESVVDAVRRSWLGCVEPILASAGTVIIGLLCLLLSDLQSNQSLGPVGAIGIAASVVAALTLLPAILLTGRWLFWPRIPRVGTAVEGAEKKGLWGRVAGLVGTHPRRVWAITAVILAAFCLAIPTFKASGTDQTDVFLTDVDSVAGQAALAAHFPGGSGDPILVIAPETALDDVVAAVGSVDGLSGDPVPTVDRASGQTLVVDGRVELQLTAASAETDQAEQTVRDLRAALHALPEGSEILVGGTTAVQLDTLETSQRDLGVIIPTVLIAVFIVLVLLLRALVAPLLLMLCTVLSFGTALGVAALVFNNLFDFPGADPAVPLFAFIFLVALGIDYSIFLMTRAREEVALHGNTVGVQRAVRVTGGVITSAGVVLAATFSALAVIPILFLAQIAFIVAFGVLLDTLVVRTLLVPALVIDVGKKAWWPIEPKPRRHQRTSAPEPVAAGK